MLGIMDSVPRALGDFVVVGRSGDDEEPDRRSFIQGDRKRCSRYFSVSSLRSRCLPLLNEDVIR